MSEVSWWLMPLTVIGVLALTSGIVTLFFRLGRRPRRIWIEEPVPVDSDAFLHAVSHNLNAPILTGGTARLLNNGDEYYPRMLEVIAGARRSINCTCYIWEPGQVSDGFFGALIERAGAGVEVRVLLDGYGCRNAPEDDIRRLEDAGGRVAWFRRFHFGKLLRFHKRNHRRAFIIDGRTGFTGGAAIGDKWLGNAQDPQHWRDVMVEVDGPMAVNLQAAFSGMWAYAAGELLSSAEHFPPDVLAASPRPDAGGDVPGSDEPPTRHLNIVSSPSSDSHPLRLLFLLTFFGARERLWIASPYFVPDAFTREVVESRARAGVDVRILVPNELTDASPIRQATRSYYDELLSAGVRIYEYQPTMMHAKLCVADGIWSIVGSANMDIRSKELNKENVLCIRDARFAGEVEAAFLADVDRADEIRLDAWRQRALHHRIKERVSVLFAEQY